MSKLKTNREINYSPAGPVTKAFLQGSDFIRGIMGPIGSGKSTACVLEILRRSQMQAPSPDGIRRTRWAIIRNSYPELKTTTLKTWAEWCPLGFGKVNMDSPFVHHVKEGDLDMEVFFMALDRPEDAKKLLSLEVTGAWVNEAREVPKLIIDTLSGRVGRYPSKVMGGATWSGIIMDTNPPDNQSWWYKVAEEDTPKDWSFYKQPSGLSPNAENVDNLPKNYYKRLVSGKDEDWVKIYVHGEYGFLNEGQAVYPMYRDRVHCAEGEITAVDGLPLVIGADFGLTPCAVIGQRLPDGRWIIIDEYVTDNCGIIRFAELLAAFMARRYPDFTVGTAYCDPAGAQRGQSDLKTAIELMNTHTSWKWRAAPSNELSMRLEVVKAALNRMVDGSPGLLLSPRCKSIRKGFTGGYHYKLVRSGDGTQTYETPNKNQYSHPHDGLQYLLLGGGEGEVVRGRERRRDSAKGPVFAKGRDYKIFG